MNKVILVGRLTRDPELRYSQGSEPLAIARYTLAVNRKFKREGEADADFIFCVAFGKQAEFVEKYLKKGMQVAVSGRISVRSWDDQGGQKRWSTEVVVEDHEFTESKAAFESRSAAGDPYANVATPAPPPAAAAQASQAPQAAPQKQEPYYAPEGFAAIAESIDDDDLPF
jgi:single-strand DNA-binding protein